MSSVPGPSEAPTQARAHALERLHALLRAEFPDLPAEPLCNEMTKVVARTEALARELAEQKIQLAAVLGSKHFRDFVNWQQGYSTAYDELLPTLKRLAGDDDTWRVVGMISDCASRLEWGS